MLRTTFFKFATVVSAMCSVLTLHAQMGMDLSLNRSTYMQFEPVYACVTLRNDTGRALVFGDDPRLQGFLLFEIKNSKGQIVPKRPDADITVTGLVLGSGEIKRMIIPLNKYYNIDPLDSYEINAYVTHSMLKAEYKTRNIRFTVEKGVEKWSRTVGIPDLTGQNEGKTVERTYSIRAMTEGSNRYYYLLVEDNDKIYGVMQIGRQLGIEQFKVEIDMLSRIHLLMPISPKVFHYLSFSLNGVNTTNQYWRTTDTIPALYRDPISGKVELIGGAQARPGLDFKDPDTGKVSAAQLLQDDGEPVEPAKRPQAPTASGLVDLGQSVTAD